MNTADSAIGGNRAITRIPTAIFLLLAAFTTLWLYRDVFVWLVRSWKNNSDYSHGFAIPVFVAYVLWTTRHRLLRINHSSGNLLALGLFAIALGIRLSGIYTRVMTLEGLSLIPYLMALFVAIFGGSAFDGQPLRWPFSCLCCLCQHDSRKSKRSPANDCNNDQHLWNSDPRSAGIRRGKRDHFDQRPNRCGRSMQRHSDAVLILCVDCGVCMMIDRSPIEKLLIGISAIPIAIIVNCIGSRLPRWPMNFSHLDWQRAFFMIWLVG